MDVTKPPPLDPLAHVVKAAPTSRQNVASTSPENVVPLVDRVDIQPLELAAALQILITEVRAGLELPADLLLASGLVSDSMPHSPAQASRVLIQLFLQAVPEDARNAPLGAAGLARIEHAFQSAVDRAVDVVGAWRGVPQSVMDAANETRALVVSQLSDEPPSPLWLRPEWLGLAPTIQRFWRRRRLARRGLTDPDARPSREAEKRDPDWHDV